MARHSSLCCLSMALLVLGIAVNLVAGQEPSVIGDAQELLDLAWSKEDSSSAARVLGEYYEQGGNVASLAGVFNSEESASPEARDFVITASIFEAVEANPEIVQFFADLFLAMIADDASSAVADITVAAIRSSQGQPAIFGQIFDLISDSEGCTAIQDTINSVQETTRSIGNIRGFLDEFIDGYKNLGACVDCFDETPDDAQTCAERKLFGQCTSDWLIDGYFCAKTCDLCTAVAAAPAKATSKPAKATSKPAKATSKPAKEIVEEPVEETGAKSEVSVPQVEPVVETGSPVEVTGLIEDRTAISDILPSPLPRPRLISADQEDTVSVDPTPEIEQAVPSTVEIVPAPEPAVEQDAAMVMPVAEKLSFASLPGEETIAAAVPSPEAATISTPVPAPVPLFAPTVVEEPVEEDAPTESLTVPLPRVQLEPTIEPFIEPVAASVAISQRPALKLTPEEENEALTVAQTVSAGTTSIAVSLLTGLGKEGKSSSVAEGLARALELSSLGVVAEALGQVIQDPLAPEFFKDPLSTALFLGGKPIADAIVLGMVLAAEQGEVDSVVSMLNVLIQQGGQVSTLIEEAIQDVFGTENCEIMKEVTTAAQILAEDEGLATALLTLLTLDRIKCAAATLPAAASAAPLPAVSVDPVESPLVEEPVVSAVAAVPVAEAEESSAIPVLPASAPAATSDIDSTVVQSLAESEAVLTASAVFVDAINGFETNPDVSGITGAFAASLAEGQQVELLALILSVYTQLEDKDLLGRALGAVAAQAEPQVISVIAGGLAQIAIATGCEGVGTPLILINNATSAEGVGDIWQEAVASQGDVLVQCLGADLEDCNQAAQSDCCLGAEAPQECHFCDFDIGCRFQRDPSSIEALGLLVYKDRFFSQICKCPLVI